MKSKTQLELISKLLNILVYLFNNKKYIDEIGNNGNLDKSIFDIMFNILKTDNSCVDDINKILANNNETIRILYINTLPVILDFSDGSSKVVENTFNELKEILASNFNGVEEVKKICNDLSLDNPSLCSAKNKWERLFRRTINGTDNNPFLVIPTLTISELIRKCKELNN